MTTCVALLMNSLVSHNQFVIVRLDRTIQYFIDSPIKSGDDVVVDL